MDKTAFQQLQAQLVQCSPVESFCAAGCRTLEIYRQVLKGGLRGQRADAPAGHADGIPLFQIPLLFVGKLLNRCRDRLCLYSVPEDFGVVPAIVACHILAGFFAVLVLFRAVEGNNAAVALGNGQQLVRRYAFVLVSALDGKLGNDFCAVFAELL